MRYILTLWQRNLGLTFLSWASLVNKLVPYAWLSSGITITILLLLGVHTNLHTCIMHLSIHKNTCIYTDAYMQIQIRLCIQLYMLLYMYAYRGTGVPA